MCVLPSFFRRVCRRNIAAVYAQRSISGNGVGLHYSRFRPSRKIFVMENQNLGNRHPSENRLPPRRIREDGLALIGGQAVVRMALTDVTDAPTNLFWSGIAVTMMLISF